MRRIGLVGVGVHMVENLMPALRTLPDCMVAGVAARHPERAREFAERWGVPRHFGSYTELLADPFDLVVIASTPQVHLAATTAAVEAGAPVFVEKPPAPDLASLRRLVDIVSSSRGTVDVGYNFRFAASIQRLLTIVDRLGGLRHARIVIQSRKPTRPMWGLSSNFASFVYAVGIHAIELACSLFGTPTSVDSVLTQIGAERIHCTVILQFSEGTTCEISMSNAASRFAFDVELSGTEGWASCGNLSDVQWAPYEDSEFGPKVTQSLNTSGLLGGYHRSGYATLLNSCLSEAVEDRTTALIHSIAVYGVIEAILGCADVDAFPPGGSSAN